MSQLKVYSDHNRIAELSEEMDGIEELIAYWLAVSDPDQLEEAPSQIAVLETDLASLKMEFKVIEEHIKLRP